MWFAKFAKESIPLNSVVLKDKRASSVCRVHAQACAQTQWAACQLPSVTDGHAERSFAQANLTTLPKPCRVDISLGYQSAYHIRLVGVP
jgi:hypothetical protein